MHNNKGYVCNSSVICITSCAYSDMQAPPRLYLFLCKKNDQSPNCIMNTWLSIRYFNESGICILLKVAMNMLNELKSVSL